MVLLRITARLLASALFLAAALLGAAGGICLAICGALNEVGDHAE